MNTWRKGLYAAGSNLVLKKKEVFRRRKQSAHRRPINIKARGLRR